MPNVECEVCGGVDFFKESGHFYCKECQTQTQELQEHVFEADLTTRNKKSTKKVKKRDEKPDNKLTSWECNNIILCSLTNQLIELGADLKLKRVVKCLWLHYLEKLEVIKKGNELPKLPLSKYKKDAEILYGTKRAKRRRRSTSVGSTSTLNTSLSQKRDRSKKKRALAETHLDEITQKSHESHSLHNETLTSIKSSSDKSSQHGGKIYNKYAMKELRSRVGKIHLKRHLQNEELKCHKVTQRNCSHKYTSTIITPKKLYCLLYLGLLIVGDKMQIGDLLHFINDGNLAFNYYTHLFPEEYHDKSLNFNNFSNNSTFTSSGFRKTSAGLVNFLAIHKYLSVPDLPQLCRRYCKELNLPDTICNCAINLILKSSPKMHFVKTNSCLPNYEGRVMSIILIVLKVLFGLDDVTEYEFSKYAELCNLSLSDCTMFDIVSWLRYLEYRSLIINEHHFPTQYINDNDCVDSDMYLQYIAGKPKQYDEDCPLTKPMEEYKQLIGKLKDLQEYYHNVIEFPPSITRFRDYSEILTKSQYIQSKGYMCDILELDFTNNSIEFLLKPTSYLKIVNENVEKKSGGANLNWAFNEIKTCIVEETEQFKKDRALITVELKKSQNEYIGPGWPEIAKQDIDSKYLQDAFLQGREYTFKKNKDKIYKPISNISAVNHLESGRKYLTHYHPFEAYWMNFRRYINDVSKIKFQQFFSEYPYTFQQILTEMARAIGQNTQELFIEYQLTEAYLVYGFKYNKKEQLRKIENIKLRNILARAKRNW